MIKLQHALKKHKLYLYGLLFVTFITLFFMGLFFSKSVNLQEGWYNIFAQNLLAGKLPYRDFFYIMPPVFLYFWTALQAVFGSNFIVFHIADIFLKLTVGLLFYHLLTRLFSPRISALCAGLSQIIFISIVYDNGVISYNSLRIAFMFIIALVMLAQTDYIKKHSKVNNKLFAILGIVYAFAFLTKQTDGPFNIAASFLTMALIVYKRFGFKSIIKPFLITLASSLAALAVLLAPFIFGGALGDFVNNVFLSYGAKGKLSDIFGRISTVIFNNDFTWPAFVIISGGYALLRLSAEKKYSVLPSFKKEKGSTKKFLLTAAALYVLAFVIAFSVSKIMFSLRPFKLGIDKFSGTLNEIVAVSLFFLFFMAIYQGVKILSNKKFLYNNSRLFIVMALFLSSFITHTLSYGSPSGYFYVAGFAFAVLLSVKTYADKFKNVFLYLIIFTAAVYGFIVKINAPSVFHGWRTSPLVAEGYGYSSIPKLKGIKLAKEERTALEAFYETSNKYTVKGDTILAFNNNQVFYELLERQPFNQYISLYHDVSTDAQALETLEQLKITPPKEIVFLAFPSDKEWFHEQLFRGGEISGQRQLSAFIHHLIQEGQYIPVLSYERYDFYNPDKLADPSLAQRFTEIDQSLKSVLKKLKKSDIPDRELLKEEIFLKDIHGELRQKVKYSKEVKNAFLEEGYKLMLLIRADIYNREQEQGAKEFYDGK